MFFVFVKRTREKLSAMCKFDMTLRYVNQHAFFVGKAVFFAIEKLENIKGGAHA